MALKPKNIVYLYSEIMPYAISVMRALVQNFDLQVDCIYWDKNKRTPFIPQDEPGIFFHKRSSFTKESIFNFISERNPSIIYVSGRMDKLYLDTVIKFKRISKVVSGSDNQWFGNIKQKAGSILSPFLYKKFFDYFWVPGRHQYEFARRIGYTNDRIINNLLTADDSVFGNAYNNNRMDKQINYPHNIVYAGRFAKTKGVDTLITAFTEVKEAFPNNWILTLIGSGDLPISSRPDIVVKNFMSGEELARESKDFGVFCLPSTYEPWGVVIHEAAMMGLPVICSHNAGAADSLVIHNYNGLLFRGGDKAALKNSILNVMNNPDETLLQMGERSYMLSNMQSPLIAAYSLMSIL